MSRVLFVCKKNETYGFSHALKKSAGLYNSTRFVVEALDGNGAEAKLVEVVDNNCIDAEVAAFKPDACIIEALWVVPEKFKELKRLHPTVVWYVHLHSHIPFLALEGIALDWIVACNKLGVRLIVNSLDARLALHGVVDAVYLPNCYSLTPTVLRAPKAKHVLDIGCFGAIRPLKNQLLQALAAVEYARLINCSLRFHVNSSRLETNGDPVLKNLIAFFAATPDAELIQVPWMDHEDFLAYLSNIDIGMQVSLTETFNIVTADLVTSGIPVVVSDQVYWASRFSVVRADSLKSMVEGLRVAHRSLLLPYWNRFLLKRAARKARAEWALFAKLRCAP